MIDNDTHVYDAVACRQVNLDDSGAADYSAVLNGSNKPMHEYTLIINRHWLLLNQICVADYFSLLATTASAVSPLTNGILPEDRPRK